MHQRKTTKKRGVRNEYSVIGLDIAKNIFHMYTLIEDKTVKKKLKRGELLTFFCQLPRESNRNRSVWKCSPLGKRINKIRS